MKLLSNVAKFPRTARCQRRPYFHDGRHQERRAIREMVSALEDRQMLWQCDDHEQFDPKGVSVRFHAWPGEGVCLLRRQRTRRSNLAWRRQCSTTTRWASGSIWARAQAVKLMGSYAASQDLWRGALPPEEAARHSPALGVVMQADTDKRVQRLACQTSGVWVSGAGADSCVAGV